MKIDSLFVKPGSHFCWALLLGGGLQIAVATAGTKVLPVLNQPISDQLTMADAPVSVSLDSAFGTEAIDDQVVRFTYMDPDTELPEMLDIALFSNRTPITRTNFLNYVNGGDYTNSFIHRSKPGFVVQGGGFVLDGSSIVAVPADPPIVNEFGISNTLGTVSMAKKSSGPDTATSQWFVSMGANSNILDPQNGGFTVFGRITMETFATAQRFGNPAEFPVFSYEIPVFPTVFNDWPLKLGHVPPSVQSDELILFTNVGLAPLPVGQAGEVTTLGYSVGFNSDPAIADAVVSPVGDLILTPTGNKTGVISIRVRATDSVGNSVDDTFLAAVFDSYPIWANGQTFPGGNDGAMQNPDSDSWSNLEEYAFLGNPGLPDAADSVVFSGTTGVAPGDRFLTLTFPVRKYVSGLSYAVEANDGVTGSWSEIWKSSDGFYHPRVVSFAGQSDRTVVTIMDNQPIDGHPKRFLRVRVVND